MNYLFLHEQAFCFSFENLSHNKFGIFRESKINSGTKVAEHSLGSLSVCHLPYHGKRKVAAHKLKLGK